MYVGDGGASNSADDIAVGGQLDAAGLRLFLQWRLEALVYVKSLVCFAVPNQRLLVVVKGCDVHGKRSLQRKVERTLWLLWLISCLMQISMI